jgi:hypothetical protein
MEVRIITKKKIFSLLNYLFLVLYTAGPLAFLATGHSTEILNYIYAMDIPSWFIVAVKMFIAWP